MVVAVVGGAVAGGAVVELARYVTVVDAESPSPPPLSPKKRPTPRPANRMIAAAMVPATKPSCLRPGAVRPAPAERSMARRVFGCEGRGAGGGADAPATVAGAPQAWQNWAPSGMVFPHSPQNISPSLRSSPWDECSADGYSDGGMTRSLRRMRRSGRDSTHLLRNCRPRLASGAARTARCSTVHWTVSLTLAPSRVRNPGLPGRRPLLNVRSRRSGRDSNPRDGVKPPTRFPVVLLQPTRTPLRSAACPPQTGAIIAHGSCRRARQAIGPRRRSLRPGGLSPHHDRPDDEGQEGGGSPWGEERADRVEGDLGS